MNPELEIVSDTEAFIVRGAARWKLEGGMAADIIAHYRHCLAHPGTGATDAALFLWGLVDGLHHAALINAQETIERIGRRRLDMPEA